MNNPLYFIVFAKDQNIDTRLDYFVFQYLTAKKKEDFKEYLNNEQSKITVTKNSDNNYDISFLPIEVNQVTYFIKAAYVKGLFMWKI